MSARSRWIAGATFLVVALAVLPLVAPSIARSGDDDAVRVERMYQDYKERSFAELPDVEVARAAALADSLAATDATADDVVWLDVRDARERRISVLPGAIDRETYEDRREELAGRPVIVYCTVGYRSGLAARDLRRQGVDAHNLAGGILAWAHADGEVLDGRTGEPTRRVHVYGWRWNLLPDGWKAVW